MPSQSTVFVSEYKHIGRITVSVRDSSAEVVSALGMRVYDFPGLSPGIDNRHTMLKLSMKYYFSELLVSQNKINADNKNSWSLSHLSSRISSMFSRKPLLPASTVFSDNLVILMNTENQEYVWEDTERFSEYKGVYDAETVFQQSIPVYIPSEAWPDICCHLRDKLIAKYYTSSENVKKISGDEAKCVFLASEIKYVKEARTILSELSSNCYSAQVFEEFRAVIETYERFIGECLFILHQENVIDDETSSMLVHFKPSDNTNTFTDAIDILKYLWGRLPILESCSSFMKFYGRLTAGISLGSAAKLDHRLSIGFATIVQKITNLPRVLYSLVNEDRSIYPLIKGFLELNENLNRAMENATLKYERMHAIQKYRSIMELDGICSIFTSEKLLGKISCYIMLKGPWHGLLGPEKRSITVLLFETVVIVMGRKGELLGKMALCTTTFSLFEKKLFFFGKPDRFDSAIFRTESISGLVFLALNYGSREETQEFIEVFYRTKYNAVLNHRNLFFVPTKTKPANGIILEKVSDGPGYSMIHANAVVQPAVPLDRLIPTLEEVQKGISRTALEDENEKVKIKILHSYMRDDEMRRYSIQVQPDHDVSFKLRIDMLNTLIEIITSDEEIIDEPLPNRTADYDYLSGRLYKLGCFQLHPSSKLWLFDDKLVEWCVRKYLQMIISEYKSRKEIAGISFCRISLVLLIFLERNIYYLFSPKEIVENRMKMLSEQLVSDDKVAKILKAAYTISSKHLPIALSIIQALFETRKHSSQILRITKEILQKDAQ